MLRESRWQTKFIKQWTGWVILGIFSDKLCILTSLHHLNHDSDAVSSTDMQQLKIEKQTVVHTLISLDSSQVEQSTSNQQHRNFEISCDLIDVSVSGH